MAQNNRQVFNKFLDLVNSGRVREGFETCVSEHYVQHNPSIADGREAAIEMLELMAGTPGFQPRVHRVVEHGDLIASHLQIEFGDGRPGMAVMDMFRFENGKIVEHWDVMQEIPEKALNGNSMF